MKTLCHCTNVLRKPFCAAAQNCRKKVQRPYLAILCSHCSTFRPFSEMLLTYIGIAFIDIAHAELYADTCIHYVFYAFIISTYITTALKNAIFMHFSHFTNFKICVFYVNLKFFYLNTIYKCFPEHDLPTIFVETKYTHACISQIRMFLHNITCAYFLSKLNTHVFTKQLARFCQAEFTFSC